MNVDIYTFSAAGVCCCTAFRCSAEFLLSHQLSSRFSSFSKFKGVINDHGCLKVFYTFSPRQKILVYSVQLPNPAYLRRAQQQLTSTQLPAFSSPFRRENALGRRPGSTTGCSLDRSGIFCCSSFRRSCSEKELSPSWHVNPKYCTHWQYFRGMV